MPRNGCDHGPEHHYGGRDVQGGPIAGCNVEGCRCRGWAWHPRSTAEVKRYAYEHGFDDEELGRR